MNYYVYTLARPDGTVFYVGKGSGNRVAHHEKEALRGHNCPKCELIRSIWRDGGIIQRAIVFETDDERAALEYEADLIRAYGYDRLVIGTGQAWAAEFVTHDWHAERRMTPCAPNLKNSMCVLAGSKQPLYHSLIE